MEWGERLVLARASGSKRTVLTPPHPPRAMLYIFSIEGTDFVKAGFTAGCPWGRVRDGFWPLVHPEECCGKLAWENLQLLALSPGTMVDEALMQECVPPVAGEFWRRQDLDPLGLFFKVQSISEHGCDNENWELPLPPKPETPPLGRGIEKRPCCGGVSAVCYACRKSFTLWIHLSTHMRESCPARREAGWEAARVGCGVCARPVIQRNLKRHQDSQKCKSSGVL